MTVRQMAAVVGGAQQESRPVIFPVANRPDFLWLSASLEWLREARREAGWGHGSLALLSSPVMGGGGGGKPQRAFLLPHGRARGLASYSVSEEFS